MVNGPDCPPFTIKFPNGSDPNNCVAELCLTLPELSIVNTKSVANDPGSPINRNAGAAAVPEPVDVIVGLLALPATVNGTPEDTVIVVAPLMFVGLVLLPIVVVAAPEILIFVGPVTAVVLDALPIVVVHAPAVLIFVVPEIVVVVPF